MEVTACTRPLLRSRLCTPSTSYFFTYTNVSYLDHLRRNNKYLRVENITNKPAYQRRHAHSRRHVSSTALPVTDAQAAVDESYEPSASTSLSCLPLSTLIRSYVITAISTQPLLVRPGIAGLSYLAHSKSRWLNPDTSPLLRALLKKTFYAQFCAGETSVEVKTTIENLKQMGYKGVIMGHAKEAVLTKSDEDGLDASNDCADQVSRNEADITMWKKNTLDTIELAQKDDFVALKFTGAGRQALQHLKKTIPCAPAFEEAVHEMCQKAQSKGVCLLFDAEQAALQEGIDNWTMYFARQYNHGDKALVYGTYQAYAKKTPGVLAQHLEIARKEDFVLGIKLVRGAYLGSDPRELFWPTIEDTHKCYDGIAKSVIQQKYGEVLKPIEGGSTEFPKVNLVLASHNAESVRKARALRDEQAVNGEKRIKMAYGQLMGMADNVSCEIVQSANARKESEKEDTDIPKAYKYLVWGKLSECMKYLLRRAHENKDAVTSTVEARKALGHELARRIRLAN